MMKKQYALAIFLFLISILSLPISTDAMSCSKVSKLARRDALTRIAEARRSEAFRENCIYLTLGASAAVLLTIMNDDVGVFFGPQVFLASAVLCASASRLRAKIDPINNLNIISKTLRLHNQNQLLRSRYVSNPNTFLNAVRAHHVDQARPYAAAFNNLSVMKKELVKAKLVLNKMPKHTRLDEGAIHEEVEIKKQKIAKQENIIDSLLNILYSDEQAKNEIAEDNRLAMQLAIQAQSSERGSKRCNEVAQRA